MTFDHVVVAVHDLEAAAAIMLADHGLAAIPGGRHPGHGTANMIVPLGEDYVELVAVVDPQEAGASRFGAFVADRAVPGRLTPAAVCLRPSALDPLARRLGITPTAMSRTTPAGDRLEWRLAGLESALTDGLPFFIEWEATPAFHPGRTDAPHRVRPVGITWAEVATDRDQLARWLGPTELDLRPVGPGRTPRAGITTVDGEFQL